MGNAETQTLPQSEEERLRRVSQLEKEITAIIPKLRESFDTILRTENEIKKLTEDDTYEGVTEELVMQAEDLDSRTLQRSLGEPLEFDTDLEDEEESIFSVSEFDDDEVDMGETDISEAHDILTAKYVEVVSQFRQIAEQWFKIYNQLQPLKSDSPALMQIDVKELTKILDRISN